MCTRDRPLALRSCLESLQALDYPLSRYEVIVVDNASREATTRELAFQAGFRCVREEKPGLDNARNCGAASATYDIVAYTDDDVRVDPGWLKGIARGFAYGDSVCVTGLICPLELETPSAATLRTIRRHGQRHAAEVDQSCKPALLSDPGGSQCWSWREYGLPANADFRHGRIRSGSRCRNALAGRRRSRYVSSPACSRP